jgi:mitogen-activated protein kinase kinase
MKLPDGLPPAHGDGSKQPNANEAMPAPAPNGGGSIFTRFSDFVDTKNGALKFAGKAVIHSQGVDFSSPTNFSISLDEANTLEDV